MYPYLNPPKQESKETKRIWRKKRLFSQESCSSTSIAWSSLWGEPGFKTSNPALPTIELSKKEKEKENVV
jgi:hypothetical protein